jgi:hypothetical protein
MCNDQDLILGYVYGELADVQSRAFETHIASCAACRNEVAALRATRGHLASWTPPEPDFGFRIVRGADAPAPPARRPWFAPAWGLAAAAVLVLAAAAAIANVEVRYDASGLMVRTGWARDAAAPQTPASSTDSRVAQVSTTPAQSQIASIDARLRELESAVAARQNAGGTQLAAGPRMTDAEILRRVREVVRESETRQQREMALQIAGVVSDVDRARRLDFMQIQRGLGQLRGQTSAEVTQQVNQQWNHLLTRVSQQK